jgi:hypothetical protein
MPSRSSAPRSSLEGRFRLDHVSDDALHAGVKTLTGRHNALTAELLAHLAEVDARGIYRERACSSLYTYCVYELRLSEDEAQRRARVARTAREFPLLFEMLAEGAIHLTGILLLAPYLTPGNHAELLARARFRTKREIEHLVAEIAPRPDVPARVEPLGPTPAGRDSWQAYTASLRGAVRELAPGVGAGQAPPAAVEDWARGAESAGGAQAGQDATGPVDSRAGLCGEVDGEPLESSSDEGSGMSSALARVDAPPSSLGTGSRGPLRYRVEFTASQRYVELLEEARDLLQYQVADRDVARVHELAMAVFVEQLRKRRRVGCDHTRRTEGSAPARVAEVDAGGSPPARAGEASEGSAPARADGASEKSAPARVAGTPHASASVQMVVRERDLRRSRYIPTEIRRTVWRRDGARCTFEDSSGHRCQERGGLEIHHEQAFALGGATTFENLRLLCRAHNALHAERDFGRAHVECLKNRRK